MLIRSKSQTTVNNITKYENRFLSFTPGFEKKANLSEGH